MCRLGPTAPILVVCPSMSRPFAAVESFLERILERPAARLFHAHPQPVQLERRIERAMNAMRMVAGGHTYVPSRYRILLNPADLEALEASDGDVPSLLADAILVRAREHGQWLLRRPDVTLVAASRIAQGDLEVDAEPLDPSLVAAAATGLRPVELEGPKPPRAPIPGTGVIDDQAVVPPLAPMPASPLAEHPQHPPEAGRAAIPVIAEMATPPPILVAPSRASAAAAPPSAAAPSAAAPSPRHPPPRHPPPRHPLSRHPLSRHPLSRHPLSRHRCRATAVAPPAGPRSRHPRLGTGGAPPPPEAVEQAGP